MKVERKRKENMKNSQTCAEFSTFFNVNNFTSLNRKEKGKIRIRIPLNR